MSGPQWFYIKDGQRIGPVDESQVKHLASSGEIAPRDYVWHEEMSDWVRAESVDGLTNTGPTESVSAPTTQASNVSPTAAAPVYTNAPRPGVQMAAPSGGGGIPLWAILSIVGGVVFLLLAAVGVLFYTAIASFQQTVGMANWNMNKWTRQSDASIILYLDFEQYNFNGAGLSNQAMPQFNQPMAVTVPATKTGKATPTADVDDEQPFTNHSALTADFTKIVAQQPQWTEGRWPGKGALKFDGQADPNGDFMVLSNHKQLDLTHKGVTLMVSIKQAAKHDGTIISKTTGDDDGYELYVTDDAVHLRIGRDILRSVDLLGDNEWHLIVVTIDDGTATLYVDGVAEESVQGIVIESTESDLYVGRRAPKKEGFFNGDIDELAIWKKVFADWEVESMYEESSKE